MCVRACACVCACVCFGVLCVLACACVVRVLVRVCVRVCSSSSLPSPSSSLLRRRRCRPVVAVAVVVAVAAVAVVAVAAASATAASLRLAMFELCLFHYLVCVCCAGRSNLAFIAQRSQRRNALLERFTGSHCAYPISAHFAHRCLVHWSPLRRLVESACSQRARANPSSRRAWTDDGSIEGGTSRDLCFAYFIISCACVVFIL